jgi:hypothetical protein
MSIANDITLTRTYDSLAQAVESFYKLRLGTDPKFTANQLRFFVQNNYTAKTSPGSADRVLRMLRKAGKVEYVVLNRAQSLYEARPVTAVEATIKSLVSPTTTI